MPHLLPFTFNRRSARAVPDRKHPRTATQLMRSWKISAQRDGAARQFASRL